MQTSALDNQYIPVSSNGALRLSKGYEAKSQKLSYSDKKDCLTAVYRQIFKDNRDLDFYHNEKLDSEYLNGQYTTQELVRELLCSDMYVNFILTTNSNYRFVQLCFERVLGRPATQSEMFKWSSLLASEGIRSFAEKLTECDEYVAAFGSDGIPHRRSLKLFSSDQNMPALPKELSIKRYQGEGNENQYLYAGGGRINPLWSGSQPPELARKVGAIATVAGAIEIGRIVLTVAWQAITSGNL